MPITPEARRARQEVKAAIGSQFWDLPVHSTRSLDGQLWSLPAEPPPLGITGSSGLSRTQQLIAAQAVRLPFLPSYDGSADGVVLDRVLAKTGGRRWWTALSGRVKAQRLYNRATATDGSKLEAVRDLGNYALCARGRFQLGRRLTFNGVVEAPNADQLQRRLARLLSEQGKGAGAAGGTDASSEGAGAGAGAGEGSPTANAGSEAAAEGGGGDAGGEGSAARAVTPQVVDVAVASLAAHLAPPELEPYTAHATLRCALPGHDLSATAGYNLNYLDSTGDAAHVPLAVSLDLTSHDRQDGLQYRVGLHQVTAPPTEMPQRPGALQRWRTSLHAQGALAVEGEAYIWKGGSKESKEGKEAREAKDSSSGGTGTAKEGLNATAAAVAGTAQAAAQAAADVPAAAAKQQQKGSSAVGRSEEGGTGTGGGSGGGPDEAQRTKLASAPPSAAAATEEPVLPDKLGGMRKRGMTADEAPAVGNKAQQPPSSQADRAQAAAQASNRGSEQAPAAAAAAVGGAVLAAREGGASGAAASASQPGSAALEHFIRPLEQMGELESQPGQQQPGSAGGSSGDGNGSKQAGAGPSLPQQQAQAGGELSSGSAPGPRSGGSSLLGGLSSHSITSTIQDSVVLLQQVKKNVEKLTSNVQDGSLQRLSQQLADSRAAPTRRRPYSVLLAQPHLKLNAALGCLARMPLPALRSFSFPHASLEPLEHYHPHPPGLSASAGGASAQHASTSSLASRGSHSSHLAEAWQPYLKGTALRVFASAGMSGQLGRFARPFLDYTAASARLDVGLTSPHVVGVVPDASALAAAAADGGHRPDKHRAFALEGRGAWHALSVSLAQQVVGPIRARVDARFALDPTSVPASEGERSTLKGVLQTALSVRPSLLEATYGFDCVLPGTEGAARLAIWVSPKRRECMAELRLF